ncbi:MAG: APC family permease [Terriglobales bacterium]
MASNPGLRPSLGLCQATALAVGIMIGATVFVQASEVSRALSNPWAMLAAWAAAGALTLAGALTCAELARQFPQTGGVYIFLRETLSPGVAFLWGWAMFWLMHSGIIAAIAIIAARYCGFTAALGEPAIRSLAIAFILLFSGLNYRGLRPAAAAQVGLTAVKVVAIAAVIALVAEAAPGRVAVAASGFGSAAAPWPGLGSFVLAASAGLFAFGGWHMVTYTAGETKRAARVVPLALWLATAIVTLCYLGLNAAYLRALPIARIQASNRVAAEAAAVFGGPGAAAAIAALVVISALGSLNGVILAGPRVYLAMAADHLAPQALAAVHPRFLTPARAIGAQAAWSCLLVAVGSYHSLFTGVVYLEWTFFALMAFGLLRRLRRGHGPALVLLVGAAAVAASLARAGPAGALADLALVATGVPAYYGLSRRSRAQRHATHH